MYNFSEGIRQEAHHARKEVTICNEREGGVNEDKPSILHTPLLHFPRSRQTLYPSVSMLHIMLSDRHSKTCIICDFNRVFM